MRRGSLDHSARPSHSSGVDSSSASRVRGERVSHAESRRRVLWVGSTPATSLVTGGQPLISVQAWVHCAKSVQMGPLPSMHSLDGVFQ